MQRYSKNIGKNQVLRTETGRDRSDGGHTKQAIMGKEMRDTGVGHSLKGNMVPKDMNVRGKGRM